MAVTSEQLCASRRHCDELRAELATVSMQFEQQQEMLKDVASQAHREVEQLKDEAVNEMVTRHKAMLAVEEEKFENQLKALEEKMQQQRDELTKEDDETRKDQMAIKKSIELEARDKMESLKENLNTKEREIQSTFSKALESEQEKVANVEKEMEKLTKAEQQLLHKIEHFAEKEKMIDLVAQRQEFEAQMRELRLEHRERIRVFEEQSAELLVAKQRFFTERFDHIQEQQKEQAEAAKDFDLAGQEMLATQEAAYEEDLKRQEEFLQRMFERSMKTRAEVERMNGEEAKKLQMRGDKKSFRGRIAKLRAELP